MKTFYRNGEPFFPVGCQAHNSSAYRMADLDRAIHALRLMGGNTMTVPVYWEQIEPEEGLFYFEMLGALIEKFQKEDIALIIDWFGTWKNGAAKYVPIWVKTDPVRFRRVVDMNGNELFVLSSHCEENVKADCAAFAAFMKALHGFDPQGKTVIAVQVENEPGIYPGAVRDHSAREEWEAPLPRALTDFMVAYPESTISTQWYKHHQNSENWESAFGQNAAEYFTAYSIAGYIDRVAAAGAAHHETTLLVNAWIQEKGWRIPGLDYPAGGPVARVLDIWKMRTPHIDMIGPDAYLQTPSEYHDCLKAYARPDNPLFIPEAGKEAWHSQFMLEAVGTHAAVGYMCFGLEGMLDERNMLRADREATAGSMRVMAALAGALLHHRHWRRVVINQSEYAEIQYMEWSEYVAVAYFLNCKTGGNDGDWNWHDHLHADYKERLRRIDGRGRGLILQASAHEFFVAGDGFRVQFLKKHGLGERLSPFAAKEGLIGRACGYLTVEEGCFAMNGEYQALKLRNGDESDFGIWAEPDSGAIRVRLIP